MDKITIKEKVSARKFLGITQYEVAKDTFQTQTKISKYEHGLINSYILDEYYLGLIEKEQTIRRRINEKVQSVEHRGNT